MNNFRLYSKHYTKKNFLSFYIMQFADFEFDFSFFTHHRQLCFLSAPIYLVFDRAFQNAFNDVLQSMKEDGF